MPLSFLEAEHLRISRESAEFSAPKGFARTKLVLFGRRSGLTKPSGQSLRNPSSAEFPAVGTLSGIGPEARPTDRLARMETLRARPLQNHQYDTTGGWRATRM